MGLDKDQVSRHKRVVVQQDGDHIYEEHTVQDTNLELRQTVYKVTQKEVITHTITWDLVQKKENDNT